MTNDPETQQSNTTSSNSRRFPSENLSMGEQAGNDKAKTVSSIPNEPPYKEFQKVIGIIAGLGLSTTAPSAFSLVGMTSVFGDTSQVAMADIKRASVLLSWSSACFSIALIFIVAAQLLYTDFVITQLLLRNVDGAKRLVRVWVGIFAWIPLGLQVAGIFLLCEALMICAPGATQLGRYGIVIAACAVAVVAVIGVLSTDAGKRGLMGLRKIGRRLPHMPRFRN